MASPGIYAWWVDADGAQALSDALGLALEPGLIYVGEAGATRWPSGRPSSNTLQARLADILNGTIESSTLRKTLSAILRGPLGLDHTHEEHLSAWMSAHLRVAAWPTRDADLLHRVESTVRDTLDPPLNLKSMKQTDLRTRISQLRRQTEA